MQKKLIKEGDIIKLGNHILACGSATDKEFVAKAVGESKIDLILTDPPYGVSYVESKKGFQKLTKEKNIQNDAISNENEYENFSQDWMSAVLPFMSSKNAVYIFNCDKMLFSLRRAMDVSGIKFSQLLIWVKNSAVMGRLDYLPQHELIAYGWYGKHKFKGGKGKSVLFHKRPHKSKLHPTMKSPALLRELILNSTDKGEVVYDCFGGSGSTLVACEHTKRKCIMIELDPEYCETIRKRYYKLVDHD